MDTAEYTIAHPLDTKASANASSRVSTFDRRESTSPSPAQSGRALVTIIVPAYNEAPILETNLALLDAHLRTLRDAYVFEMLVVNDGSSDDTGRLAERFAQSRSNVRVLHHATNRGLGEAVRSAIAESKGDFVVVLDLDLSYSPQHIERLLAELWATEAKVVIASPYMKDGRLSNVPWFRRVLSTWANRLLSLTANANVTTLTGMVRAYDGPFLRTLDLKSTGMDVNPEIIHKALLLNARVTEIPAHLDWRLQARDSQQRKSSIRILPQVNAVLLAGYLFRPVMFFVVPGVLILLVAMYANIWMLFHFVEHWQGLAQYSWVPSRASAAAAAAYDASPHTFIVGLMGAVLGVQLTGLGFLALQNQRYFEEAFHLGTSLYRRLNNER